MLSLSTRRALSALVALLTALVCVAGTSAPRETKMDDLKAGVRQLRSEVQELRSKLVSAISNSDPPSEAAAPGRSLQTSGAGGSVSFSWDGESLNIQNSAAEKSIEMSVLGDLNVTGNIYLNGNLMRSAPEPTLNPTTAPTVTTAPTPKPTTAPSIGVKTFCSQPSDMTQDANYYTDASWVFGETSDDGTDCLATAVLGDTVSGFLYDENSENYEDTTSTLTFYVKDYQSFNAFSLTARAVSTTPYYASMAQANGYQCRVTTTDASRVNLWLSSSGSNLDRDTSNYLDENTWYKIELVVVGETITCSMSKVDTGVQLATLTVTSGTHTSGYNGISVNADGTNNFEIMFGEYTMFES